MRPESTSNLPDVYEHGLTRRTALINGVRAAGGIALGSSLLAACGGDDDAGPAVATGDLDFAGIEIQPLADEFSGPIFDWYRDNLNEESNITIGDVIPFPTGRGELETIAPALVGGSSPQWQLQVHSALYLGDFVATGNLEPLGPYLETFPGYEEYEEGVRPIYRDFYMRSRGETFALVADGDLLILHYRPSFFEDETLRRAFESQHGRELAVPETWEEYIEVAQFFTDELEGDGMHGTDLLGARDWVWGWWLAFAGSKGVEYFDDDMNPQINSPAGVEALELLIRVAEAAPPGVENLNITETISNWQSGSVVMSPWWTDLGEFTALADVQLDLDDVAAAPLPGTRDEDGNLVRRTGFVGGRIFTVPANQDEDAKRAAAWTAYRLSHPDYSVVSVADPHCGLDPYHDAHFTDEAAEQYTTPNPMRPGRGTPDNDGSYQDVEQARNLIETIDESSTSGLPQPVWPGSTEYTRVLGTEIQNALSGQKDAQSALDDAADQFTEIVQNRGEEEQAEFYGEFLETARELGVVD